MISIHKSFSKTELLELINELKLPIIFSFADNKKDIHDKFNELCRLYPILTIDTNFYKICNMVDLKIYLSSSNPKKILTVKEKNNIMVICRHIINYCKSGKNLDCSIYYNHVKDIEDDLNHIKMFGDIPSVRRTCTYYNKSLPIKDRYIPLISPQMQKILNEKKKSSTLLLSNLKINNTKIKIYFD